MNRIGHLAAAGHTLLISDTEDERGSVIDAHLPGKRATDQPGQTPPFVSCAKAQAADTRIESGRGGPQISVCGFQKRAAKCGQVRQVGEGLKCPPGPRRPVPPSQRQGPCLHPGGRPRHQRRHQEEETDRQLHAGWVELDLSLPTRQGPRPRLPRPDCRSRHPIRDLRRRPQHRLRRRGPRSDPLPVRRTAHCELTRYVSHTASSTG